MKTSNVGKNAKALAVERYQILNNGECDKDFGFKDQVRRAAVSIASNIAAGRERETDSRGVHQIFVYCERGGR
ncbi:MAG: four helix bundle protein [Nitrospira sp.]|nr:four helix bundle protein [Nitrospira sp.]